MTQTYDLAAASFGAFAAVADVCCWASVCKPHLLMSIRASLHGDSDVRTDRMSTRPTHNSLQREVIFPSFVQSPYTTASV